jgi:hypothetical protein
MTNSDLMLYPNRVAVNTETDRRGQREASFALWSSAIRPGPANGGRRAWAPRLPKRPEFPGTAAPH